MTKITIVYGEHPNTLRATSMADRPGKVHLALLLGEDTDVSAFYLPACKAISITTPAGMMSFGLTESLTDQLLKVADRIRAERVSDLEVAHN